MCRPIWKTLTVYLNNFAYTETTQIEAKETNEKKTHKNEYTRKTPMRAYTSTHVPNDNDDSDKQRTRQRQRNNTTNVKLYRTTKIDCLPACLLGLVCITLSAYFKLRKKHTTRRRRPTKWKKRTKKIIIWIYTQYNELTEWSGVHSDSARRWKHNSLTDTEQYTKCIYTFFIIIFFFHSLGLFIACT